MFEDFEGQVWKKEINKTKNLANTERKLVESELALKFTELDSSHGKKLLILNPTVLRPKKKF